MSIGSEIPFRRSPLKDGQHTGSLVLDQHRKASAEQDSETRAGELSAQEARNKKIPVS